MSVLDEELEGDSMLRKLLAGEGDWLVVLLLLRLRTARASGREALREAFGVALSARAGAALRGRGVALLLRSESPWLLLLCVRCLSDMTSLRAR